MDAFELLPCPTLVFLDLLFREADAAQEQRSRHLLLAAIHQLTATLRRLVALLQEVLIDFRRSRRAAGSR